MQTEKNLIGVWKLTSYEVEIQESGEIILSMGKNPSGFACFTENHYVMVTLTAENRKKAANDQEKLSYLILSSRTLVSTASRVMNG